MRLMSFAATEAQIMDGSKTVTRRLGWRWLAEHFDGSWPGEYPLMAVRKAMGLGKGGRVHRLRPIAVVDARVEPLDRITPEDVVREGFPDLGVDGFIDLFARVNSTKVERARALPVTRIEYSYPCPVGLVYADSYDNTPRLIGTCIRTSFVAQRFRAGETVTEIAYECEVSDETIRAALAWEGVLP